MSLRDNGNYSDGYNAGWKACENQLQKEIAQLRMDVQEHDHSRQLAVEGRIEAQQENAALRAARKEASNV